MCDGDYRAFNIPSLYLNLGTLFFFWSFLKRETKSVSSFINLHVASCFCMYAQWGDVAADSGVGFLKTVYIIVLQNSKADFSPRTCPCFPVLHARTHALELFRYKSIISVTWKRLFYRQFSPSENTVEYFVYQEVNTSARNTSMRLLCLLPEHSDITT